MIDEKIKNEMLDGMKKLADKWKQEPAFTEPRPRWFRIGKVKMAMGKEEVYYAVAILVGKDEKELMQMLDELTEWHKKYVVDQKDVSREEDYTQKPL